MVNVMVIYVVVVNVDVFEVVVVDQGLVVVVKVLSVHVVFHVDWFHVYWRLHVVVDGLVVVDHMMWRRWV